ncbi:transcription factor EMB1444-like isoform X2 [Gastrolobium bilobum]|uniref:transcription factor EMB1444-like isoform X2 n=1 Tax=Gastrolobium bilobum TaxID=150636 RepID=UPI002AB29A9B|nr:transcription factor EMB1444-like isoform X2 [Gastrolobium bilobum]
MGTNLHQVLRSLCFNTHWNYAIFWKLKRRARMILTWEDAYYDNLHDYDSSGNKYCQKTLEQIGSSQFSYDAIGLAVAKMSYHVYSIGEGIVGQVAVTGKHRWICADDQVTGSGLSFEFADGWQSQFSAGIRTIVVVAVVPLGVVQLGSLNKVVEDMGVVTHIRNLFLSTQDYSIGHVSSQRQTSLKNSSSLPDVLKGKFCSDIMPACLHDTEKIMKSETMDVSMPLQCSGKNYSPHSAYEKMAGNMAKHDGPEFCDDESSILLQSISNMMNMEHKEFEEMRPLNRRKCEGGSSGSKDMRLELKKSISSFLHNSVRDNASFNDLTCLSEKVRLDSVCFPSVFFDALVCESDELHYVDINHKGVLNFARPSDANSQKHIKKSKFKTEPSDKDASYKLKFPAGCELHDALGPAFLKGSKYFDWVAQVNQDAKTVDIQDEISTSQLTSESRPEHLLEAMMANTCHSINDINSELSFCASMQSALASGKNAEASIHNVHIVDSEGCSVDQPSLVREDKHYCLSSSSGICGVMSPKGVSSTCPSSYSEQFERSSEPAKNRKKRARPGESCRPRPRDRQLIQDRVKELRELVPNGAKCSIDSLLERAIKHMLFLQSITKHADKLTKFADTKSKLHHIETDILGSSSYEQGSSWAMEVGGHLKVHSILVENLSKNGQMLVEMLCEECSHILEIAEAITSLGLKILKGATKAHGEKIWICFVVEGQNNRNVHRLDILLPLVQILQSKTTMCSQ